MQNQTPQFMGGIEASTDPTIFILGQKNDGSVFKPSRYTIEFGGIDIVFGDRHPRILDNHHKIVYRIISKRPVIAQIVGYPLYDLWSERFVIRPL